MKFYKKLLILVIVSSLFCAEINRGDARKVANNVFNKFNKNTTDIFKVKKLNIIESDEKAPLFYIFNLLPNGFVIVSAEDKTLPVLGYSFENEFKYENMPRSLESIFNGYKNQIKDIRMSNQESRENIINAWEEFLSDNISEDETRDVNPLIDAEFDQGGAWNNLVQGEIGFNAPVGCVAAVSRREDRREHAPG